MYLRDRRVAVVGAGIGGLAAALAVRRRGADVTIFEQSCDFAEVGAGIQIAPNGLAVLEALDLREAAEAVASFPSAVALHDAFSGRRITRVPLGSTAVTRYGRPYLQLHRADLLRVLVNAVVAAGIRLCLGSRVAKIEPAASQALVLPVGSGTLPFDFVVAADGVRSPTRAALFDSPAPRFTGHVAWRGLVPRQHSMDPVGTSVFMGPGRHLVAYPLREGKLVNVVAVEERPSWAEEGWSHPDDPQAVRRAYAGWAPEVEQLLSELDRVFLWGIFDHAPLAAWTEGRVALLGDACHPMVPFLAQGATMALEDAWVLAAELDHAADPLAGLRAYERRRKPRVTRVQRAAARSGRIYHLREPLRTMAHAGMAIAGRVAPSRLMGRFDWIYGEDVVSGTAQP
jgi:salicylate hydroxylase